MTERIHAEDEADNIYEYWLANVEKLSCRKKRELRMHAGCAEALYYIEESQLKEWGCDEKECQTLLESIRTWKLDEEYQNLHKKQTILLTIDSPGYPERLRNIPSPPYALYVKGKLPEEHIKTVAIVGARECSPYGRQMAEIFAKTLAEAGVQIISGMARGVDAVSQRAALQAGGRSFGVLGNGVDICYPREHISLYTELQRSGGLISEQPLGMKPLPQFFPARNRIISGLSDVVLVIEAKEKSGSLITADMALEQGKDVYALPGPVTSHLSKGCHNLIRQGAGILTSPQELLEELSISATQNLLNSEENQNVLESTENLVYSCLRFHPESLHTLLNKTGLSIPELLHAIMQLELKGYIQEISKNYYTKVK